MPKTATVVQSSAEMVSGGVDGQDGFSMTPCDLLGDWNGQNGEHECAMRAQTRIIKLSLSLSLCSFSSCHVLTQHILSHKQHYFCCNTTRTTTMLYGYGTTYGANSQAMLAISIKYVSVSMRVLFLWDNVAIIEYGSIKQLLTLSCWNLWHSSKGQTPLSENGAQTKP